MTQQVLTILGSTGSIGRSTLAVVDRHRDRFQLFALTANSDADQLLLQCRQWRPRYAVLRQSERAGWMERALRDEGLDTELLLGDEGLQFVASDAAVDTVMAAIVGAAGLRPTLAAVSAGKKVLLANKEALVMAGELFMSAVQKSGALLLPIDSEHNAIFQCLPATHTAAAGELAQDRKLRRILLTGSGGPFRQLPLAEFSQVTPEQACLHPNWSMGKKISVDSATMMNKGLELIEACWLFGCEPRLVEIVVHPQSIIHSMVEYCDGSVLAQMGQPDMRTPIAHALAWPDRIESGVESLNWAELSALTFEAPDYQRFSALRCARTAAESGGSAPVILNASNEIAVSSFLSGRISFDRIAAVVDSCLSQMDCGAPAMLEEVESIDLRARALAEQLCGETFAV